MELRPYQVSAVEALRQAMRDNYKRVILSSPTGSGKTEMGFEIIRGAQAKGRRIAFVANRIQLVEQTCRRLDKAGFSYGVIQGNNTKEPWRSILVCSIQTLNSRGCPDLDLLVIDEAHAAAGTEAYREVMAGLPVIGLTATPYSKGLGKHYPMLGGALFEKVIVAANINKLIDEGYLVSADIWSSPLEPELKGLKVTAGDYNEKELGEAVDKVHLIGDIVEHWFKIANDTPTVVFATNISHSKHIMEKFIHAGVTAEHIDCYTSETDRLAILDRVSSGETRVICNVGVLAEGWDFPACKTLILARPTKSLIRYLQMAGRVLRPFPGKDRATILDHSGVVRRLGFPWDAFSMPLHDGKPTAGSYSTVEKKEPLPTVCPKCNFVRVGVKCPQCGFEAMRPDGVGTIDGELVPLTKRVAVAPGLATMGRQTIYSQLLWIAQKHKYSDGWAKHKYHKIFKNWPNRQDYILEPACGALLSWVQSENIAFAKGRKA